MVNRLEQFRGGKIFVVEHIYSTRGGTFSLEFINKKVETVDFIVDASKYSLAHTLRDSIIPRL